MPEFWHVKVIYFYPFLYVFWNSLKLRNKFYPLILNPAIDEFGGFIGASKETINSRFPKKYLPHTLIFHPKKDSITDFLIRAGKEITFPAFIKPEDAYKGIGVQKLESMVELESYLNTYSYPVMLQNTIPYSVEFGVFVIRVPGKKVRIINLVEKQLLHVVGDGKHSIEELLKKNVRYKIGKEYIPESTKKIMHHIPIAGEKIWVQPVGNHNKGTWFQDITDKITPEMEELFDSILPASGLHYGRFDIKAESLDSLASGENLRIVEFNGTLAEPLGYCDPKYSFFKGQRIIMQHYKAQKEVAMELLKQGAVAPGLQEGRKVNRRTKAYKKEILFTFRDKRE
ncbi:MAG: ATP-grasp domain-containing protein [Bacteroidetes bacterium]|nr:ATP-grasp domain-containing protein [Bacteroidota bacterium]